MENVNRKLNLKYFKTFIFVAVTPTQAPTKDWGPIVPGALETHLKRDTLLRRACNLRPVLQCVGDLLFP